MSRSVKLKDNTFIDSTGITHNRTLLSEILKNISSEVDDVTALKNLTAGMTDINNANLNNLTDKIYIGYGHTLTNSPLASPNNLGYLISIPRKQATGYVCQYFFPLNSTDIYTRQRNNGTWGSWKCLTEDLGVVLYDGGTTCNYGNITLSESSANYKYLEVFYSWGSTTTPFYGLKSVRVPLPITDPVCMDISIDNGTNWYCGYGTFTINASTPNVLTHDSSKDVYWRLTTGGAVTRTKNTTLSIYKVVGYK